MSDDDESTSEMVIEFKHSLKMVRIVDAMFVPTVLTVTGQAEAADPDVDGDQFDIAFTKIRFWFDAVASRCIAFSVGNEDAKSMLVRDEKSLVENVLMVTPEVPTDEHLAPLLQSKMTALSGGRIVFLTLSVSSNNMEGVTFTHVGDPSEALPDPKEWLTERNYFSRPWWERDDASAMDVVPSPEADLSSPPEWAFTLAFIEQAMTGKQHPGRVIRPGSAEIVRPAFKPQVIKGGKKPD